MADLQALSKLRDIHVPSPIGWWPLAPGWYALIGMILISFLVIFGVVIFRYKHVRAKKRALRLLSEYLMQYLQNGNVPLACIQVSELLKRVALVYYPREQVAGLQGEEWLQFLNNTAKQVDFHVLSNELLVWPYVSMQTNKSVEQQDLTLLFNTVQKWIKQRKKVCSN